MSQPVAGHRRIALLVAVMTGVAIGVGGITLYTLYTTAFEQQRQRLIETVQMEVQLMEALSGSVMRPITSLIAVLAVAPFTSVIAQEQRLPLKAVVASLVAANPAASSTSCGMPAPTHTCSSCDTPLHAVLGVH